MTAIRDVENTLENDTYKTSSFLHLQCINDFRLFQNQRQVLSLQKWSRKTVHDNLSNWAEKFKIDQITLIKRLIAPISQKNIILIEWIACEKHNECRGDKYAEPGMYCLYNIQRFCHQATEKYFDH